jgi:hypothetical protein
MRRADRVGGSVTGWAVSSVRAWMIFEDATGHRQGFEIPMAEVEYRFDCDLAEVDYMAPGGFVTMAPINKRWQWHITTHHGFTVYEPAPADTSDRQQRTITTPRKMIAQRGNDPIDGTP